MLTIELPRGDVKRISFTIYNPDDTEVSKNFTGIYFTVKNTPSDRNITLQKSLKDGTITRDGNVYGFTLASEDTDGLDFGEYVFDIEVILGKTLKQTFLGKLLITDEVTHARNE